MLSSFLLLLWSRNSSPISYDLNWVVGWRVEWATEGNGKFLEKVCENAEPGLSLEEYLHSYDFQILVDIRITRGAYLNYVFLSLFPVDLSDSVYLG